MIPEHPQLTSTIVTLTSSAVLQLRKVGPCLWYTSISLPAHKNGAKGHLCLCALHTAIPGKCGFQPSSWGCVAWERVHRSNKLFWSGLVARTGETKTIAWCRMGDAEHSLARQRL